MKKYPQFIIVLIILLITTGVEAQKEHLIQGQTMGTTYHIKVVTGASESVNGLKEKIDRRLAEINKVFSTFTDFPKVPGMVPSIHWLIYGVSGRRGVNPGSLRPTQLRPCCRRSGLSKFKL